MNYLNPFDSRTWVRPSGIMASAQFVLVGAQPGVSEIRNMKPFSGPAGNVLNDCLAGARIVRGECYITYVVKDLDQPLERYFTRTGLSAEAQTYVETLKQELEKCSANVIVAFGEEALNVLTSRTGIQKWRGSILESTLVPGKWVVPCLDPASTLPPKCVFTNLYLIMGDLAKAKRVAETPNYQLPVYEITTAPSFGQSMSFLNACAEQPAVAVDIEVHNLEVSCISFAYGDRAISIPFVDSSGDYFNPNQELDLWLKIAELLQNPAVVKIGQNLVFDYHFLLTKYGIKINNLEDTMIAQQIITSDFPKGLDFITSIYTDLPYYKDDGKQWFKVGGRWETLWHYNALDSLVCALAFPKQVAELQKSQNYETYKRQCRIVPALVYMMYHGIKVDLEGLVTAGEEMQQQASELLAELAIVAGQELNPSSPKQLKEYFYEVKKYPHYKNRKTGTDSVDDTALKRLIRKGCIEAKLIQQYRKLTKVSSTYLQPEKIDPDSRIRSSYNPVGTRFSRLSSGSTIFGTGMNLQNWPHGVQKYMTVDEGYFGIAIDLGQAENRIVAYYGNVTNMIDAFELGWDVHSLTATGIFPGYTWEQIKAEDEAKIKCSIGDGTHSRRFWGKKSNHSLNYDLGYKTFALYCEISERDAKVIVDGYHAKYPGVRNTFHRRIKDQILSQRYVTNLMGRKTRFLGRIDDNLFKDAYACVPQGTVGDIINERGMSYIYYNRELFRPIELLNQVHDEIVFQIPLPTHPTNPVSWLESARMITMIKSSLETPLRTNEREFVIPADVTLFKRFKQGKDPKFSNDLETYAQNLEATFEELI